MLRLYKEESLRWLTQAQDEFADADELRRRGRFYLALFHFQQAAEKALKAYLYLTVKSKEEVFTTHSLEDILQKAWAADRDFKEVKKAKKLDEYAIRTRYPDSLPGRIPSRYFDDSQEAEEAMHLAREVVELVERKIGEIVA
jgi:HEPN domain-containing protein